METYEATNPDFADLVKSAVLSMPAARHLGFDFAHVAPGQAEIVQPYRDELTTHDGSFQGGVIGALADFAGGSAAGTVLPAGWINATIDYTVKLVSSAKGDGLIARGRVIKPGRTVTVAAADVFSVTGTTETLCATALVTMRNINLA